MKTKRVRIAVAVNEDGKWCAMGWGGGMIGKQTDAELTSHALEGLDNDATSEHVVFIEADVPIPESVTVEGKVAP